jgi:hypothetical protein
VLRDLHHIVAGHLVHNPPIRACAPERHNAGNTIMKHATGELGFNQLDQVSGGKGLGGHLDSLGELGMEQQLRLQMTMDAFSKSSSMLSNMLKKFSDTAGAITANLK